MKIKFLHATILTCNDQFDIIEDGMVVTCNDIIEYVGVIKEYSTDKVIDCKGKVLLPGLVNGCAIIGKYSIPSSCTTLEDIDDIFKEQRQDFQMCDIQNHAEQFAHKMIRDGVTSVFDYSGFEDVCASTYAQLGLRSFIGVGIFNKGQVVTQEELEKRIQIIKQNNANAFLYSDETYTLTDEQLLPLVKMAKEYELHFPVHRSLVDVGECVKMSGLSPVAFLDELGVLSYPTKLLYGTCMDKEDMNVLKDKESMMTLCPVEDMYVGYGYAPIISYQRQGIKLGVGTGKDHVTHSTMRDAIRALIMLGSSQFHNPTILSAKDILLMCTNVYQKYRIGVLQKGYFADILLLDCKDFLNNKEDLLLIKDHLELVMVGGKMIFENKQVG